MCVIYVQDVRLDDGQLGRGYAWKTKDETPTVQALHTRGCRGGTVGRGPVIAAGETCIRARGVDGTRGGEVKSGRGENQECRGRRRRRHRRSSRIVGRNERGYTITYNIHIIMYNTHIHGIPTRIILY